MSGDARVSMARVMRAFGVPATVTRPAPADTTPIETTVAWVNPTTDGLPSGLDLQRNEHMKLMSIPRIDTGDILGVPTVPQRTVIQAPEIKGGANKTWRVDATLMKTFDETRVLVVEVL